jgi:hypothetical protein
MTSDYISEEICILVECEKNVDVGFCSLLKEEFLVPLHSTFCGPADTRSAATAEAIFSYF